MAKKKPNLGKPVPKGAAKKKAAKKREESKRKRATRLFVGKASGPLSDIMENAYRDNQQPTLADVRDKLEQLNDELQAEIEKYGDGMTLIDYDAKPPK